MNFLPGETKPNQVVVKGVVVGDTEVGKTSLCNRFYLKKWDPLTATTISASCVRTEVQIEDEKVLFCIWDTAGQEKFRSISPLYYRGAHVAMLVLDLTSKESLDVASSWVEELKTQGPVNLPLIIFGNKCDLSDRIEISTQAAEEFAKSKGAEYVEVSALTGKNVDSAFIKAANYGYQFSKKDFQVNGREGNETVNLNAKKEKSSCC
ncbi:Ras-related protein Rab-31 [Tritrichomonas foetus]|uniref:Ras-related protein Rab-31 n=1 Tax=Tritrichomonas foetus TaxID=1144522 RepID=A0A1J4K436_9EUKA|nr:Ras-related protein Rab-31 [Tritrichomonas foetus]|eukprot:OHT04516.1 Ras-related protein Rab-31 [Tritrichomonas foetus]